MGNVNACSSGGPVPHSEENNKINDQLKRDQKQFRDEIKLLLLGAGESGKSTVAKQMKILHLDGFDASERQSYKEIIHSNILTSMKTLVQATQTLNVPIQNAANRSLAERILTDPNYFIDVRIDPKLVQQIKDLWADPSIKSVYSKQNQFQLNDSAAYFLDDLERVTAPNYVPTEQDVLRSRTRTTGIIETTFTADKMHFRMMDVGGQRSERRKWMHCFQDVTAVIFCVALSEYDLKLAEDETVNRMQESLKLWREISNSRWFVRTAMILFLNKKDLFDIKIKTQNLNICFPDYNGPQTYDSAVKFIEEKFLQQVENKKKLIYTHQTCATDTKNIQTIFNIVSDVLLREVMSDVGLDL
eukprot:TRINITY_DN3227_c1_g1_i1.p1 TRINITY_DN3227_c1_g1~~TRINITY_DN3227_c1_g1_i1.p1  ORF type:complete len:368 (-),score=89.64 TRINITY_DN3227_c1_g1_i1:48-1121(-)